MKSIVMLCALLMVIPAWGQAISPAAEASLRRGLSRTATGRFWPAIRALEEADQAAPNQLQVQRALFDRLCSIGKNCRRVAARESAAVRWPKDAEIHHGLGLAYFKRSQNNKEARSELMKAIRLSSVNFGAHFDLALVLLSEEEYVAASHELETAVKLDHKDALAHVLLGRAYQNTNRSQDAVQQFRTALQTDPNVPFGHYHLGFAYESLGESAHALNEYRAEIAQNTNHPEVRYRYGHCLLDAGEWRAALPELQRATELDGTNADAYYELGKILLMAGDTEKAIKALRTATRLNTTDPSPHYLLARALEKSGNQTEADAEWARFNELKKAQPTTGGMATGRNQ